MPVDFDRVDQVAATVRDLYAEAELSLTRRVSRQLAKGLDAPGWASRQLGAVSTLRKAAARVATVLGLDMADQVRQGIADRYRSGWADGLADLVDLVSPATRTGARVREALTTTPGTRAVEALADSLVRDLRSLADRVTRDVVDGFRHVIGAAAGRVLLGADSRRDASQAAWSGLVKRGLSTFRDRSGRAWSLGSYVEMATRTVTARAAVQGHVDGLGAAGIDLVYVSDHVQECPVCRPWEGAILAVSGPTGAVTVPHAITGAPIVVHVAGTLAQARAAGLHHPNCRHSITGYLPGVTVPPRGKPDPDGYEARMRQRSLERQIRAAKLVEAAALTPEALRAARRRVRARQEALRAHLAAHPELKRLRYREQIGAGNRPPAGRGDAASAIGPDTQPTLDGGPAPEPPRRDRRAETAAAEQVAADEAARLAPGEGQGDLFDVEPEPEPEPAEPGPAEPVDLAALSDDALFDLFGEVSARDELDAAGAALLAAIGDEMDRREADDDQDDQVDDQAAQVNDDWPDQDEDPFAPLVDDTELTPEQVEIDRLMAQGYDYLDAYAEVYGADPDQLRREQRFAVADETRQAGERREDALRRAYAEWVFVQYTAAEKACRGRLLSHAADQENARRTRKREPLIIAEELFSGSTTYGRAWASPELLRWWEENPRMTYQQWKVACGIGDEADKRAAEIARGIEKNKEAY